MTITAVMQTPTSADRKEGTKEVGIHDDLGRHLIEGRLSELPIFCSNPVDFDNLQLSNTYRDILHKKALEPMMPVPSPPAGPIDETGPPGESPKPHSLSEQLAQILWSLTRNRFVLRTGVAWLFVWAWLTIIHLTLDQTRTLASMLRFPGVGGRGFDFVAVANVLGCLCSASMTILCWYRLMSITNFTFSILSYLVVYPSNTPKENTQSTSSPYEADHKLVEAVSKLFDLIPGWFRLFVYAWIYILFAGILSGFMSAFGSFATSL